MRRAGAGVVRVAPGRRRRWPVTGSGACRNPSVDPARGGPGETKSAAGPGRGVRVCPFPASADTPAARVPADSAGRLSDYTRDGLTFDVRDEGPLEPPSDRRPAARLPAVQRGPGTRVVPALHEAGLRTLAPDLRGYSPRARPTGRAAYRMGAIAERRAGPGRRGRAGPGAPGRARLGWGGGLGHGARCTPTAWHRSPCCRPRTRVRWLVAHPLPPGPEVLVHGGLPAAEAARADDRPRPARQPGQEPACRPRSPTSTPARLADPAALAGALGWYRGIPASRRRPHRPDHGADDLCLGPQGLRARAGGRPGDRAVRQARRICSSSSRPATGCRSGTPTRSPSLVLDRVASA